MEQDKMRGNVADEYSKSVKSVVQAGKLSAEAARLSRLPDNCIEMAQAVAIGTLAAKVSASTKSR